MLQNSTQHLPQANAYGKVLHLKSCCFLRRFLEASDQPTDWMSC